MALIKCNKGMKMKFLLGLCLSAVALFSNDKIVNNENVIYSQVINTKKIESNVIIKEGKDNLLSDNLSVTLNKTTGLFDIKIADNENKDYNLTLNKSIELCKKENEKYIDNTPLMYSIINTKQVVDFRELPVDLKSGHEIHLDFCKTDDVKNGFYVNLTINKYSIDTLHVKQ